MVTGLLGRNKGNATPKRGFTWALTRLGAVLTILTSFLLLPRGQAQALPVVIATIPVTGAHSVVLGVNSNTNLLYVGDFDNGSISVIDITTNTIATTIPGLKVHINDGPNDIGVNPNTNFIYVGRTVHFGGQISAIDGSTNSVSTIGGLGFHPVSLAVNAITNRIYTANQLSNDVSVIDGTTNSVIATIAGFSDPVGVGVNPVTNQIYVGNNGTDSLSVIDGATNTIVASIPLGADPFRIAVNSTINRIYATHPSSNSVAVIDGSSNSVITSISVGTQPLGLNVNMNNNRIYVANYGSDSLSVIDGNTNMVIFTVGVGDQPTGVGVNPTTSRVYVANSASNTVSVIEDIVFNFTGFFQPVDNLPTLNMVKAGSAIPVKFSLGGDQGLNIFDVGYPKSQMITCGSASDVDGIEETVTAGSSSLSYDAGTDTYTYVWKTEKAWAGTCRQLVVKLDDGTFHRANFKFR